MILSILNYIELFSCSIFVYFVSSWPISDYFWLYFEVSSCFLIPLFPTFANWFPRTTREQIKPKSLCQNQEFAKTEISFWFRSSTFSSILVSVLVTGLKFFELPGYSGSSALNFWFKQEHPG